LSACLRRLLLPLPPHPLPTHLPYTTLFRSFSNHNHTPIPATHTRPRTLGASASNIATPQPEPNPDRTRVRPGQTRTNTGSVRVRDRKSTRLNSSHVSISYAVFCLQKQNTTH